MKPLKPSEVEYSILCLQEDASIRGNCMASGDDEADEVCAKWIEKQLDQGNPWAWCTVKIVVEWQDMEGTAVLGCCSYKSEADFKAAGGYFDQMYAEALDDLNRAVSWIVDAAQERGA